MSPSHNAPSPTSPRDPRRRWPARLMLAVYLWAAALFPLAHAAAEAPVPAAVEAGTDRPAPTQLPAGHDHLTCHFCAASPTLLTAPPLVPVAVPLARLLVTVRSTPPVTHSLLAWTHHAIPPRAPPAS